MRKGRGQEGLPPSLRPAAQGKKVVLPSAEMRRVFGGEGVPQLGSRHSRFQKTMRHPKLSMTTMQLETGEWR